MSRKVRALICSALVLAGALSATSAFASDDTNVDIVAGALEIAAPTANNFASVALDGAAKTTTATLSTFSVNDKRGTGAGWTVTVQATQFREHNGTSYVAGAGAKSLPASSLRITTAPTVSASDVTASSAPAITSNLSSLALDGGSAITVATATDASDQGMGKYDFSTSTLTLSVPANAFAKTYRSDLTITTAAAPN